MSREPETLELAMILGNRLVQRVQTKPVSTLAGAAGVGYVLARGLPSVVLRMGATVAVRAMTTRLLAELAPPEPTGGPEPEPAPAKAPAKAPASADPGRAESGSTEAAPTETTSASDASSGSGESARRRPGGRTAVIVS